MRLKNKGLSLEQAAMATNMDVKTARRYLKEGRLPSQMRRGRTYRTREDNFASVWSDVETLLSGADGLEGQTIFGYLQDKYPGKFQDGELRTLQRRIKIWRATSGKSREVFFSQMYRPGEWCASDFTRLDDSGVTIQSKPFRHMIFHFVLPYSNWEAATVCYSENFESLSLGLQNALWRLGGVPKMHRTDRLSAAVKNLSNQKEFTVRYATLLDHYGLAGQKTNAGRANENGDVEQSHHRFQRALEQGLLMRGSRDFENREQYDLFVYALIEKRNRGREKRLHEELKFILPLPEIRLEDCRKFVVRVGSGSTIHVAHVTYSVHSRLIGERVEARLYADRIEIWYAQRKVEEIPRQRVEKGHFIQYRHIIEWLVRKPGAFAGYRYREDLFPTTNFRIAYDRLRFSYAHLDADREYLKILHLAAGHGEERVNLILAGMDGEATISSDVICNILKQKQAEVHKIEVRIDQVALSSYDTLLAGEEVA